jgi:aspartyl-tRNA synthetase
VVAHAIQMRAATTRIVRRVLEHHGFLDVETPLLTRSTPEGARDFLVPSRLQPGSVYALPQSPQLFKQLLMVAGLERYYQIARCFRDEDLRADRQPEFTQIDIEASFVDEEDIYALIEELMTALWRELLDVELAPPFPRLTYREALRRFGSDKPDTRYAMELVDCGQVLAATEVGVFRRVLDGGGAVLALCLRGGADLTRREFDRWTDWAKARGAGGLAWAVVEGEPTAPTLRSPLAKFLTDAETAGLLRAAEGAPGDALFFAAAPLPKAQALLGGLRVALAAERGLLEQAGTTGAWNFLWVTEAPVFEWSDDQGRWDAVHHPFTAPAPDWVDRLEDSPGDVPARAYDLVLNGVELGGGSIRIHQPDLQRRVFALLGIGQAEAEEKFGFLLRGLSYGAPPHGGIAFGMDRLAMLLAGGTSLRDVIAFPKTQSGGDPLTGAPAPATPAQLAEVGLRALPPPA